jgi:hypothetical protein
MGGKLRYLSRFKTYTFTSFNFFHKEFYTDNIKRLSNLNCMFSYLTP